MEKNKEKKPADYNRLAGIAFIGAGAAWLAIGFNIALSVSLIALGIIFLATSKNKQQ
ncbi:MAG: hypothetical protein J1D86_00690 [Alistipes sp.]|nr:hypothetical protein [Alistipes sp.]